MALISDRCTVDLNDGINFKYFITQNGMWKIDRIMYDCREDRNQENMCFLAGSERVFTELHNSCFVDIFVYFIEDLLS